MPAPPKQKPGYKTTEFWLTLFAAIVGLLVTAGVLPTEGPVAQIVGFVGATLASLGYTWARGFVKKQ